MAEVNPELLISNISHYRQEVVSAQSELQTVAGILAVEHENAKGQVFADLAGSDGAVTGEAIVDYVELSKRLSGESKKDASKAAESLAKVFAPGDDAQPIPVYFNQKSSHNNDFIVVVNSVLHPDASGQLNFTLRPSEAYGKNNFMLRAVSSGDLEIFNRGHIDLAQMHGPSPEWALRNTSNSMLIDFGRVEVVDDPEIAGDEGLLDCRDSERIYIGDAAEAVLAQSNKSPYGSYAHKPEIVALMALLRLSQGQQPTASFENDHYDSSQTHEEKTLDVISGYVGSLLGGKAEKTMSKGLPVQLHESALNHQGIGPTDILRATLKGFDQGGGAFTAADVRKISGRIEAGKKPKLPRKIVDEAFISAAEKIEERISEVGLGNGLTVTAEDLFALAEENPDLFKKALIPHQNIRIDENNRQKVVTSVVDYFRHSPRFRG